MVLDARHHWMRLAESFLSVYSKLPQPFWSCGVSIFCATVQDVQSSCRGGGAGTWNGTQLSGKVSYVLHSSYIHIVLDGLALNAV